MGTSLTITGTFPDAASEQLFIDDVTALVTKYAPQLESAALTTDFHGAPALPPVGPAAPPGPPPVVPPVPPVTPPVTPPGPPATDPAVLARLDALEARCTALEAWAAAVTAAITSLPKP